MVRHSRPGQTPPQRDIAVDAPLGPFVPTNVERAVDREELQVSVGQMVVDPPRQLAPVAIIAEPVDERWHDDAGGRPHEAITIAHVPDKASGIAFVGSATVAGLEREYLVQDRTRLENRILALLATQGIRSRPSLRNWERDLAALKTGDGRQLPPRLAAEVNRLRRQLGLVLDLIRELDAERGEVLAAAQDDTITSKVTALRSIYGVGDNFAAVLAREVFYRPFGNRRQLASYVGLAPMPHQSGDMDRDRRIGRAGNARARKTLVQLAWLWLRYQPESELSAWFRQRVGELQGRTRRIAIVAMARKLLIALWRFTETGEIPAGSAIRAA
jgi:hypothetical protein